MKPDDIARWRKICGMLGSDQPGERAAAALKASQMLKAEGLDWGSVSAGNTLSSGHLYGFRDADNGIPRPSGSMLQEQERAELQQQIEKLNQANNILGLANQSYKGTVARMLAVARENAQRIEMLTYERDALIKSAEVRSRKRTIGAEVWAWLAGEKRARQV